MIFGSVTYGEAAFGQPGAPVASYVSFPGTYGEFAWGQIGPYGGFPPAQQVETANVVISGGWFWRAPRHKRLEKYEQELREQDAIKQSQDVDPAILGKPIARVDPARAAADVAAALAAAREFVSRAYVEPGVDLSNVAARYAKVVLPSPLPKDVSDEDAIALILLLAD